VGFVWDDRIGGPQFSQAQAAARASNISLHAVTLHNSAEAEDAMKRLLVERPQAILLLTAPAIFQALPRIAELARQRCCARTTSSNRSEGNGDARPSVEQFDQVA